jgi:L-malate glycosyltransferase
LRRVAFQLADQVLSVSTVLRDLHARRTGFPAGRISVIHNGVDTHRFAPDARLRSQMRSELGIADGELCIGCVGNLTKVKDHLTILRALAAQPGLASFRLLLLGDGPERGPLTEFVQSHRQLRDSVVFLGRSRRVKELLNALDVYVLSSLTEGICNSLLEAMATRLPVIVTQTGGNPEVVTGSSGLLFPVGGVQELAAHLSNLSDHAELRHTLAENALRRIHSEFSLESMVRQYDELYQRFAPRPIAGKQRVQRAHTLGSLQ